MKSVTSLCLLIMFLFVYRGYAEVKRSNYRSDPEEFQLIQLANVVSEFKNKNNGTMPQNWSDLWDMHWLHRTVDRFYVCLYPFESYYFVENEIVVEPYRNELGRILIIDKTPTDLYKRKVDPREGLWWQYVYVTNDGKCKVAYSRVDELKIGDGPGELQLREPDITPSMLNEVKEAFMWRGLMSGVKIRTKEQWAKLGVSDLELKEFLAENNITEKSDMVKNNPHVHVAHLLTTENNKNTSNNKTTSFAILTFVLIPLFGIILFYLISRKIRPSPKNLVI